MFVPSADMYMMKKKEIPRTESSLEQSSRIFLLNMSALSAELAKTHLKKRKINHYIKGMLQ